MKVNKKIAVLMAIISVLVILSLGKVQAFSGELDPKSYIVMPSLIMVTDGIGTGTISLTASASGYDLSYQKVDLTEQQYNNITNKMDEYNKAVTNFNDTSKKEVDEVNKLGKEYQDLANSATATQEQKDAAKAEYDKALSDYNKNMETMKANLETLKNEYYALIPNYTNSWTKTTNSRDNVKLDLGTTAGKRFFALWAKVENGTNTYYDMCVVSSEVKKTEEDDNTNSTEDDDNDTNKTTEGDWTDFSNAKIELKKDGLNDAIIEISGVNFKEKSEYCVYISSDDKKPSIPSDMDPGDLENVISLYKDNDNKILATTASFNEVTKFVEKNQNIYVSVIEINLDNCTHNIVSCSNKLSKFDEPKYTTDAFYSCYATYDGLEIVTRFTHSLDNKRNMQLKIGKITDKSILQRIKNKDNSALGDLLTYAKSSEAIWNYNKNNTNTLKYSSDDGDSKIELDGKLVDGEYYFLYVNVDDENGNFIKQEAVTLARAEIYKEYERWYLIFLRID